MDSALLERQKEAKHIVQSGLVSPDGQPGQYHVGRFIVNLGDETCTCGHHDGLSCEHILAAELYRDRQWYRRERRLQEIAAHLTDLYERIVYLSADIKRWQRQIEHVDDYVATRRRLIARAEAEIEALRAKIKPLETEYDRLEAEAMANRPA